MKRTIYQEIDKISNKEVKRETIELLRTLNDICEKNGIRYWLAYGTLLGAIRHHGMIPWDDDVDVWMPAEDFDKFCKIVSGYKEIDVHHCTTNKEYIYGVARLSNNNFDVIEPNARKKYGLGIFIDIYILNGVNVDDKKHQKKMIRRWNISCLLSTKKYPRSKIWYKNLLKFPFFVLARLFIRIKPFLLKTFYLSQKYKFDNQPYCSDLSWNPTGRYKRDWFNETIFVQFEDMMLPIIGGYDDFLKYDYGDYMTPPPESKRIPYHIENVYKKHKEN